jgi:light-regulated signal transduction histidine kinase (bacteriophytochrome)
VRDLEFKNKELESFSYAISHDLRAPLRRIEGFARALHEAEAATLDSRSGRYLARIQQSTAQMLQLIDDVLHLSRVTCAEIRSRELDLSAMAAAIIERLHQEEPERPAQFRIRPGVRATGDPALLRIALENLLANAWKFSSKTEAPRIEFGVVEARGQPTYFVRDNGAGFEMAQAGRLFSPFQRLHLASEFPGSGIGLATVRRIVHRHGGTVWAESSPGHGACFYWTLGQNLSVEAGSQVTEALVQGGLGPVRTPAAPPHASV